MLPVNPEATTSHSDKVYKSRKPKLSKHCNKSIIYRTECCPLVMGNPINSLLWLLILIIISFFVAGFCAGWYILLYPLTVCISALSGLTDFLLSGIQFPHYCAKGMMSGQSLC